MLSHGHWDHGGGLLKAFEMIRAAAPQRSDTDLSAPRHVRRSVALRQPDGGVLPTALVPTPEELAAGGRRSQR